MLRMTLRMTVITVLTLGFIAGCGDSPEHKMLLAQMALKNGMPDEALKQLESVMRDMPDSEDAILLKAQAHVQLAQFDEARAILDKMIQEKPELDRAREMMIIWSHENMRTTLNKSDFHTNRALIERFEMAMSQGQAQADWVERNKQDKSEAEYRRGQFAELDAMRYIMLARALKNSLETMAVDGEQPSESVDRLKHYERQSELRFADAQQHYDRSIKADATRSEVALRLAMLLAQREKWNELWDLSAKLAEQKELPPAIVENLVLALLTMPDNVRSPKERMAVGWKLTNMVDENKRKSTQWRVTAARLHLMAGEPEKAQPILEQVLQAAPTDLNARFLLGQSLFNQKAYDQAKAVLEKLAIDARNSPQVLSLYGRTLIQTGDKLLAQEPLRRATELNPADPIARQAFISLISEFPEEGARDIAELYASNRSDPRSIRMMLQFFQVNTNKAGVAKVLEDVEKLKPRLDDHLTILISGYSGLEQHDKAEQYARELLARSPDTLERHLIVAETMLMQGKDDDVHRMLDELKTKFPDAVSVEQMLGRLYLQRRSVDKAVELLQKVVDENPRNVQARLMLAQGLASQSLIEDALANIDKVIDLDPSNLTAHSLASRIYRIMGNNEMADKHLNEIDDDQIDEASNPALLAQIKVKRGELDEAADICNRALSMGNTDAYLRLLLANIYMQKKDFRAAEGHLLALTELQPDNFQFYMVLARFYLQQKEVNKGLFELKKLQAKNEPYSRMAQAAILAAEDRDEEALRTLTEIYQPMIRDRHRDALRIAQAIGAIYAKMEKLDEAAEIFQPLIDAKLNPVEARLQQIVLTAQRDGMDDTIKRMDALADQIGPDERRYRQLIMNQFVEYKRPDRAMRLLDTWISAEPREPMLLRWKGELLTALGRPAQAIEFHARAIELDPENIGNRLRLVQTYLVDNDYPSAEKALREMTTIDTGAKIQALARLGQMYVGLGLYRQAAEAFKELETAGRPKDPRVIFAMGEALMSLDENEKAIERFKEIPNYAPQYPVAQIRLARLEERSGKMDQAMQRLSDLVSNPKYARAAAAELLTLNVRSRQNREVIEASAKALNVDMLAPQQQRAWLRVRGWLEADRGDWRAFQATVHKLIALSPESVEYVAANAVISLYQQRREEARQIYVSSPALAKTPLGRMLAVILKEKPSSEAKRAALTDYLEAMLVGDMDAARSAAGQMPAHKTIFRSDLLAVTQRSDSASPETIAACEMLAMAMLAMETGIPQLADALCDKAIELRPALTLAHSLKIAALDAQDKDLAAAAQNVGKLVPGSSLALFTAIREKNRVKDFPGAVSLAEELAKREPENDHATFLLAQLLQRVKKFDESIKLLESIWSSPGIYQGAAGNDLAYLISVYQRERVDDAYLIAGKVLQAAPDRPELLDTVGWIEFQRGNQNVALKHLNRAIVNLRDLTEVHYHLGVVYNATGNKSWARYHLERVAAETGDELHIQEAKQLLAQMGS